MGSGITGGIAANKRNDDWSGPAAADDGQHR
jgi:hypothetical protein